jgi:hypothetical protein
LLIGVIAVHLLLSNFLGFILFILTRLNSATLKHWPFKPSKLDCSLNLYRQLDYQSN